MCVSAFGRKGGEATAHNLLVKLLANLLSKLHVSTVYVLKLRCENFDDLDSARDRLSIKLTQINRPPHDCTILWISPLIPI